MKKLVFSLMALATLGFASCGSGHNEEDNASNCMICEATANGITAASEICKGDDGTITVTTNGKEEVVEGFTFNELIEISEGYGQFCSSY